MLNHIHRVRERQRVLGTRPFMQKQDQHSVMVKNLRMRDKRDTHGERERERDAQRINYIQGGTSYKMTTTLQQQLQGHFI